MTFLLFVIYSLALFVVGFVCGALAVMGSLEEPEPESLLPPAPRLQLVVDNTPMDAA